MSIVDFFKKHLEIQENSADKIALRIVEQETNLNTMRTYDEKAASEESMLKRLKDESADRELRYAIFVALSVMLETVEQSTYNELMRFSGENQDFVDRYLEEYS